MIGRSIPHLVPRVQAVAICAKQTQIADIRCPITKAVIPHTCSPLVSELSRRVDVVNIKDAVIVFAARDASAAKFNDQSKFAPPIGRVLVLFEAVFVPMVFATLIRAKAMLARTSASFARVLPFPTGGKVAGPAAILSSTIFEAVRVGFKRLFAVAAGDCNSALFHFENIQHKRAKVNFDIACRRIEQAQRQGDLFIDGAAA